MVKSKGRLCLIGFSKSEKIQDRTILEIGSEGEKRYACADVKGIFPARHRK
jgi:hypothetical protein